MSGSALTLRSWPLAAIGLLAPLMAMIAPKGLAPLVIVLLFGVVAVERLEKRAVPGWPPSLPWAFVALAAWAIASAAWSITPVASLKLGGLLVVYLIGAAVLAGHAKALDADGRRAVEVAVLAGIGIGAFYYWFERLAGYPMTMLLHGIDPAYQAQFATANNLAAKFNPGLGVAAILIWPAAFAGFRRGSPLPSMAVAIPMVAAIAVGLSAAAQVALVAGGVFVAATQVAGRKAAAGLLALAFGLQVVAAPLPGKLFTLTDFQPVPKSGLLSLVPRSQLPRAVIAVFASDKIADRPLLGHGLDTTRSLPDNRAFTVVWRRPLPDGRIDMTPFETELMPLHPHNMVLHLWVELGLIGLVLALLGLWSVARRAIRGRPAAAGIRLAVFGSWGVMASLSFGVWQHWWLSTGVLAAILTLTLTAGEEETP